MLKKHVIKKAIGILGAVFFLLLSVPGARAEAIDYSEQFFRGTIVGIRGSGQEDYFGAEKHYQMLDVRIDEGEMDGQVFEVDYINQLIQGVPQRLREGQSVVLVKSDLDGEVTYEVYEPYRLDSLIWLAVLFVGLAVVISGRKGLSALIGLAATLLILIRWVIPGIVAGISPLLISFGGAVVIAMISIYLSHGFSRRTTLAVLSTLFTLCLSLLMAILSVRFTALFGTGSEETIYLSSFGNFDLRGLLLGAIVIGTLGVLDDITTTQVAAVEEIHKANHTLSLKQLYERGFSVGKEHIASMINTLVLAYVGASFPVFLLITKSPQPLWVILNNEYLAEEIVRTLVGSATLILAVPVATGLAAVYFTKKR
ncbi:YibE/F family protein [Candidatus Peregrinibacteria bacterium]|nr:YibE/F family protein [Candidatus Peregrinibacteria bacterium]